MWITPHYSLYIASDSIDLRKDIYLSFSTIG
nr:MAG TPA: hypothetical protein [Caudoviricetes sp.]